MPVIKPISIHETPKRLITYILNPDKNEDMKLATGLCCHADTETAYQEFKEVFCRFSGHNFSKRSLTHDQKNNILMFHYIQSFVPGECSPELAHKIGVEWARRVFGDKRPVLISTHDDRSHIHNHFAVSVFDYDGKRWYENKKSLRRCRELSDKLAKEYGLSVIDEPGYHSDQRYGDWLYRKSGTSWKVKLANDIDRLIVDSNVKNIDDLVDRLKGKGYEVRRRKYISIRAPRGKHFIRSFKLGDGYSLEALMYRIENKDTVMSATDLTKYEGIQYQYAICLREMQMMIYRKKENTLNATYNDLVRSADLLCFLVNNHVSNEEQFKDLVSTADEKYREAEKRRADTERRITFEEKLISDSKRFLELWRTDERTPEETEEMENYRVLIDYGLYKEGEVDRHRQKLNKLREELPELTSETDRLKGERDIAANNFRYYLEQMQGDFGMSLRRKRSEHEVRRKDHKDIERSVKPQEELQEYREIRRWSSEAR